MTFTAISSKQKEDDELRRRIGRLFIVGFHGQTVNDNIKKLIHAPYYVGQIVLFQRNVRDARQLRNLTRDLQQIAREAGHEYPLTIGIDQENGLVTRIKPPIAPQLPGSMTLGAAGSIEHARKVAGATAQILHAVGISMNYAPVCDVNNNPSNPVIGVRSFGDDAEAAARLAAASINGLRDEGVIPCVKHYPGHGDTAVDSHYGLPRIDKSWDDLERCELIPFRRAVAERVPAIMTAHIVVGGSKVPATLDPVALGILRKCLKYAGVIVSDCLEMNAIRTECGGTVQGAVTALKSGCDCVMICHTIELQAGAIDAVFEAARQDPSFSNQLLESFDRVSAFNQQKFTLDPQKSGGYGYASFESLPLINEKIGSLAAEVYVRSTTLVRAEQGVLPFHEDQKVVFISPGEIAVASGVVESGDVKTRVPYTPPDFIDVLRVHNPTVQDVRFHEDGSGDEKVFAAASAADVVILATRNARLAPYQREMALSLAVQVKKLVVVATCDPYDFLDDEATVRNYLAIYEPTSAAFKAAADVIFGVEQAHGRLPVSQPRPRPLIESFDSERHMEEVCTLWHNLLPGYAVPRDHLADLLLRPRNKHFVALSGPSIVGFVATFTQQLSPGSPPKGLISAILVRQSHQDKGIGTALINHARTYLSSAPHSCNTVTIGSAFPRFFPGVPTDILPQHLSWFSRRGFPPGADPTARGVTARDLYMSLASDVPNAAITARLSRAAGQEVTFRPWSKEGERECLTKQRANFSHYGGWVEGYEALAAAGLHDQIMVGRAADGSQIAWTMMLAPDTPVFWNDLAFPRLLGKSTGLIACVGVDEDSREAGVGLALVAAALEDLKNRGVEKVFVDWVTLDGWYEKLGLETWREYLAVEWRRAGSSFEE